MANAQTILFGCDPTEGIVAVEPQAETVLLYRRAGAAVVTEEHEFRRWLVTTEQHPLTGAHWTRLAGEGFCFLAEFADRTSYQNAHYWLRDAHAQHIALPTSSKQYLTRSGKTLFKGMAFDDIVRMQLDIETYSLRPDHPDAGVFLVSVSDNTGFQTLISGDERSILTQTRRVYTRARPGCDRRTQHPQLRLAVSGDTGADALRKPCDRPRWIRDDFRHAAGLRHRLFLHAVRPRAHPRQACDGHAAGRAAPRCREGEPLSHGLKAVCQALGISEEDRELIPGDRIGAEWRTNPERVKKYALQDALETRSLADLICPADFYLTQMVPDTYSRVATTGTGEKINSIFIREYLRQGLAIPKPCDPKPLPGGYTEVRATGVIERIVKCDVESLYPSIMLIRDIKPESDSLGVFGPALDELTRRRLDAKANSKNTTGREHAYWDGLQSAFKILINSFYGYLAAPLNFNDYAAAAQVTTTGQSVVKQIIEQLEATGSAVIEVDTDGVFFQPPAEIDTEERETQYIDSIGSTLPAGIRLAHDGRYSAMISLKMKNYALATYDGKKIFRGSALRSRADEPFGLEFISKAVDHLLARRTGKGEGALSVDLAQIESGELGIHKFARRERITEKTFQSLSRDASRRRRGMPKSANM